MTVKTSKTTAKATTKKVVKTTVKTTKKAPTKKFGTGLFKPVTVTPALAKIVGSGKMTRASVVKAIWAYIKKNKLNAGRIITPDATLKAVIPAAKIDMLKM